MPVIVVVYIGVWVLAVVGYIWNIVKIVAAISEPIDPMFIIRCVGTVAIPLGAILGYL